ncbi:MAG TPA: hypothetical protein VD926_09750 [Acidimicrobiales bacterium]|nr:hypothetical protein [Acidimicrobiales bacterium]
MGGLPGRVATTGTLGLLLLAAGLGIRVQMAVELPHDVAVMDVGVQSDGRTLDVLLVACQDGGVAVTASADEVRIRGWGRDAGPTAVCLPFRVRVRLDERLGGRTLVDGHTGRRLDPFRCDRPLEVEGCRPSAPVSDP